MGRPVSCRRVAFAGSSALVQREVERGSAAPGSLSTSGLGNGGRVVWGQVVFTSPGLANAHVQLNHCVLWTIAASTRRAAAGRVGAVEFSSFVVVRKYSRASPLIRQRRASSEIHARIRQAADDLWTAIGVKPKESTSARLNHGKCELRRPHRQFSGSLLTWHADSSAG